MLPPPSDDLELMALVDSIDEEAAHDFASAIVGALATHQRSFSRCYPADETGRRALAAILEDVGNRYMDLADRLAATAS